MKMRGPILVLAAFGAGLGAIASCSLDLDETLIEAGVPDASDDVTVEETSTPDAPVSTSDSAAPPPPAACAKDDDCKSTDGCLKGKCDLSRKACVFDACRPAACSAATCDTTKHTCGTGVPYKYRAGVFPVSGTVGCGGSATRCFAAVYPFVFVGTPNGAVAYSAANPTSATATEVPIVGLGFVPNQIVASGNRVFFLGPSTGTGGGARVPIAWADVPANPFAGRVVVNTVLATLDRPAADGLSLFLRSGDSALLVDGDSAKSYPSVPLVPPLNEPVNLTSVALPFPAGANPVAISGTRLVFRSVNASHLPVLSFINNAGGPSPSNAGDVTLTAAGPVATPDAFAATTDGTVVWSIATLDTQDAGASVQKVKAFFVVADGTSSFDATQAIDLETYPQTGDPAVGPAPGTFLAGPVAMLDGKTAMVLTAAAANQAQTSVQFITRATTPPSVVANPDKTARVAVLTVSVDKLAATASNGIGYVLAAESPTSTNVYTFDPGCAP